MADRTVADAAVKVIKAVQEIRRDDIIIAFMGPTGVGKSYFIDLLTNQMGKRSGNTLKSVTAGIEATRVRHPHTGEDNIVLVDTPGFDDSTMSDFQVLTMISNWLEETYKLHNRDVKLSGLLYLHRITDNRVAGASHKNLRMFGNLCGDTATSRVVLVSTMWEKIRPGEQGIGERRETQLQEEFWKPFIEKGSGVERLKESTLKEAWRVVDLAIKRHKDREVVLLQEELVDLGRRLNETEAGKTLYTDLQKFLAEQRNTLESILSQLKNIDDKKLRKELEKEYKKIQVQFERTFDEVDKLKVPLSRRVRNLFSLKSIHAKAIKIRK